MVRPSSSRDGTMPVLWPGASGAKVARTIRKNRCRCIGDTRAYLYPHTYPPKPDGDIDQSASIICWLVTTHNARTGRYRRSEQAGRRDAAWLVPGRNYQRSNKLRSAVPVWKFLLSCRQQPLPLVRPETLPSWSVFACHDTTGGNSRMCFPRGRIDGVLSKLPISCNYCTVRLST